MSARRIVLVFALLAGCGQPPGRHPIAGPDTRMKPLAHDRAAKRVPKLHELRMNRVEADALREDLARLPKFPLQLSELEAHLGRPLRRHFNPESFDPTFVHDRGGTGANNGGTPVFHPSVDPGTPLLVELRSKYYARYDTARRFDERPPFAADDPIIDLITISDEYAHGPAPAAPSSDVFEGDYTYVGERWSIAPLHAGYVSLLSHDRKVNPSAQRWVYELATDRGYFNSPAEIAQTELTLNRFIEAITSGLDMPTLLASLERDHPQHYDVGILELGLASYNVRFFDAALSEEPHAGAFLRDEGLAQALYIDFYIQGEARVPLPRFFGALGSKSVTLDPSSLAEVATGLRDGGLQFYDNVTIEKDGWYVKATGFYPVENGKAASMLDLSRFWFVR